MAVTINLDNLSNVSLQVGDTAFFVPTSNNFLNSGVSVAGFDGAMVPRTIGVITAISEDRNSITINEEVLIPNEGDFILFVKDPNVNASGIKGTFAEITMELDTNRRGELFSVGVEVKESSK
jgi:hypothetical protein